jgi:hypothetical protein
MDLLASGERYVGFGGGMDQATSLGPRGTCLIDSVCPPDARSGRGLGTGARPASRRLSAGTRDAYNTRITPRFLAVLHHLPGGTAPGTTERLGRIARRRRCFADGALSGHPLQRFRHVVTEGHWWTGPAGWRTRDRTSPGG